MKLFAKLEKLSEKYIEGLFRRKKTEKIQPVEIAQQLAREMRDKKAVSLSKTYVPNKYKIYLSDRDWDELAFFMTSLAQEMQEFVINKAREKDYVLVSLPVIEFALDKNLARGAFYIESKFSDDPGTYENMENTLVVGKKVAKADETDNFNGITIVRTSPQPPEAILVLETGKNKGISFQLGEKTLIIGRQKESDIFIDDTNVSRRHAKIEAIMGEYYIKDLNSTNGTYVNGKRISKIKLAPGDKIKVGVTLLEYRVV